MSMRVSLFATCVGDQFYAEACADAVRLLRHLGVAVEVPAGLTCCGQPAYNARAALVLQQADAAYRSAIERAIRADSNAEVSEDETGLHVGWLSRKTLRAVVAVLGERS